jgi:hypothetical protein
MISSSLRRLLLSLTAATLAVSFAAAQSTPVDPSTASKANPNPATSTTTDEEGNNPMAREGDHSPTGQNPANLPKPNDSTIGQSGSSPNQSGSSPDQSSPEMNLRGEQGGRAMPPD